MQNFEYYIVSGTFVFAYGCNSKTEHLKPGFVGSSVFCPETRQFSYLVIICIPLFLPIEYHFQASHYLTTCAVHILVILLYVPSLSGSGRI